MALTETQIDAAARALARARTAGALLSDLGPDLTPPTVADGYHIQDRFRAAWQDRLAGWKIGATAAAVQAKFGLTEPFAGPVFARDTFTSPGRPASARFPHHCLESEFAFRFDRSLAPRPTRYARDEIVAAIGALVPAIEIVGPRFDSLLFGRAPTAIADCGVNAGFILGAPVAAWRGFDLPGHAVKISVDGVVKGEGSGANVLGDPLVVLDWAVNHLSARGIALEAGQFISTGTTTGIVYIAPGATAVADFGALGSVEVRFDGAPPANLVAGP
jgi:2-keto-4-pentenoate hydratase